jgi:hypothetical protein
MKKKVEILLRKDESKRFQIGQIIYNPKLKMFTEVTTENAKWMKDSVIEGHPIDANPVLIFFVFNDPIMKNDLYFTRDGEIKECVGGETRKQLKDCKKIAALPHQIPTDKDSLMKLSKIMKQGGWFEIEMEDEFTNPKKFENVGWGDGLPQPILVNDKVLI